MCSIINSFSTEVDLKKVDLNLLRSEFEKDALQCLETRCSVMASLVMKYLIDF